MREAEELKIELLKLSSSLKVFMNNNRDKLSSQSVLIHDLRDLGFTKIGTKRWALDLKLHDISYVSFILEFRGNSVDLTEDHMIIAEGKEIPVSKVRKPYTLTSVRYGKVMGEMLGRVKELTEMFRGEMDNE